MWRPGFNPWVKKIPLEKGMATYSSILAWRIPGSEEPGGLQSMELQGVRYDWAINTFHWQKRLASVEEHNQPLANQQWG